MQWVFPKLRDSEHRRDPSEAELFKDGEDDTIVREIIQNSIDAAIKQANNVVRVRISIHTEKDMPSPDRLKMYFERLKEPLKTRDVSYTDQGIPKLLGRFLVCEDFGTRGLEGDPRLMDDPPTDSNERQDFYWFWRNIGRSRKTGDDLGRWGLGKTVYRMASQIGCMLGLTVRESDKHKSGIVMGQAVLKIHKYGGGKYLSDGTWCDGQEGDRDDGIPLPVERSDEVERFRKEWKLSRKDEPGLSVVVPYAVDLSGKSILQAVAVNFFASILQRKLVVEVSAPDIGLVKLTEETIEAECGKIVWDGEKSQRRHVPPPIAFAKECIIKAENAAATELLGKISNRNPELLPESFDSACLETLRAEFKLGNLVAARIRLLLHKKEKGQPVEDSFFVFLKKEDIQKEPDSYYIREGMTITKINSSRAKNNRTRGLVYIDKKTLDADKGSLAALLGDTEGPAHVDWLPKINHERPDKIWAYGWKGRVEFVKKIVDKFYEIVSPSNEEKDPEKLINFFFLPNKKAASRPTDTSHGTAGTSNAKDESVADTSPFSDFKSDAKWCRFDKLTGGFRVSHLQSQEIPSEAVLEIQMAYEASDARCSKSFTKWQPFDFNLKNEVTQIEWKSKNSKANASNGDGKTILLIDISVGFSLTVTGFNRDKDLYVEITDKSDDNKETGQ